MNFLILGGNGYIGSKITHQLVRNGHTVVCTKRANSNLSRLDDIVNQVKWIPASVDGVEATLQYIKFDYVMNMACSYGRSSDLYSSVLSANLEFTLDVLNLAVKYCICNYITVDTGLPDSIDIYSFSKKQFSEFGRFYSEKHKISFANLKLEMFYGADEPKSRFLPSVITKMINGERVETTLGIQHRDIISSEDVIKAIEIIVNSGMVGYNNIPIGTGVAPTISDIIDFIWEETGRKSMVDKGRIPMRENEPDCVADTKILCSLGKWNPTPWKEGIKDMIEKLSHMGGEYYHYSNIPSLQYTERRCAA